MEFVQGFVSNVTESLASAGLLVWLGIALCLSQSAMFSGLNLAIFSVSRLRLEVQAAGGDRNAVKVLGLRQQSNLTLATILWGNVAVNVLLTLLSGSALAGAGAFVLSTVLITFFGEIIPQAYFSRNALRMAALLAPVFRVYLLVLYPVAKVTALMLDSWLGPESIILFRKRDFQVLIRKHVETAGGDVGQVEGAGALNFLGLDEILVRDEGEIVDPLSIIAVPLAEGRPMLPAFERSPLDPFLRRLDASGKKWVIFVDPAGQPLLVLDAHHFLRDTLFDSRPTGPEVYWHRPITITEPRTPLRDVISRMIVRPEHSEDDVIDHDLILVWGKEKRIITGADLLGRLLRGIAGREPLQATRT